MDSFDRSNKELTFSIPTTVSPYLLTDDEDKDIIRAPEQNQELEQTVKKENSDPRIDFDWSGSLSTSRTIQLSYESDLHVDAENVDDAEIISAAVSERDTILTINNEKQDLRRIKEIYNAEISSRLRWTNYFKRRNVEMSRGVKRLTEQNGKGNLEVAKLGSKREYLKTLEEGAENRIMKELRSSDKQIDEVQSEIRLGNEESNLKEQLDLLLNEIKETRTKSGEFVIEVSATDLDVRKISVICGCVDELDEAIEAIGTDLWNKWICNEPIVFLSLLVGYYAVKSGKLSKSLKNFETNVGNLKEALHVLDTPRK